MIKPIKVVAVAVVAIIVLGALAYYVLLVPKVPEEVPLPVVKPTGTLVFAQAADPIALDPQRVNDLPSFQATHQMFESLIFQDENMTLHPWLAVKWEVVNATAYRFFLRKDVTFHCGFPFNASAVKYAFERFLDPAKEVPARFVLVAIDKVIVEDEYTVLIILKHPFAPFVRHLFHPATAIICPKCAEELGEDFAKAPCGTGPFKFVERKVGEYVKLIYNEKYWGPLPKVEYAIIRTIVEDATRVAELEKGAVHLTSLPPPDVKRLKDHPDIVQYRSLTLAKSHFVGIHCERKPFTDVKVRQALNYATNKTEIIAYVLEGVGYVATGPINPLVWGYNPELKPYPYDPDKARKLLAEAGYPEGFEVTITVHPGIREKIAEVLMAQWAKVGISAKIKVLEWGAYLEALMDGDFELFIVGWITATGDADYGLYDLFRTRHWANFVRYSNPAVDVLLHKARESIVPEVRLAHYHEVQRIIWEEAPWVFMSFGEVVMGVRKEVGGYVLYPTMLVRLHPVFLKP